MCENPILHLTWTYFLNLGRIYFIVKNIWYSTWCPKFAQKNPNIKINCPYVLPLRHNQATFVLATLNFYVKGFLWKKSVILATVSSRGVIQLHTAQSYQPNKVPPQSTCLIHNVGFNQKVKILFLSVVIKVGALPILFKVFLHTYTKIILL